MSDEKLRSFFQKNIYLICLTVAFSIAGVVYARLYFPDFSWFETIVGGAAFGSFCMLCSASSRLFDTE